MSKYPATARYAGQGGAKRPKIRVRRTPNALHPYIATMKGKGSYGWGNTPKEARERLKQQLAIPTDG